MGAAGSNLSGLEGLGQWADLQKKKKIEAENNDPNYNYTGSYVPTDTIKRGYDVYGQPNWSGNIPPRVMEGGGDSDANRCGHGETRTGEIFVTDGKWHKGEHRYIKCGLRCNNCDAWPDQDDARPGPIHGVRVPIGTRTTILEGATGSGATPDKFHCWWGDNNKDEIGWNWGNYHNKQETPAKIPDEVATGCAGGFNKTRGQSVKTLNGYKISHNYHNPGIKSDECYLGVDRIKQPRKSFCLKSEMDWPTFCQMGDYLTTVQGCKSECGSVKEGETPSNKRYCDYAYERLCKKRKGDPIKRDNNDNLINSDKDYLKDEPQCYKYCGPAGDPRCKQIKNDVCSRNPDEWGEDNSWIPGYCREHWQKNPDRTAMDKACKDKMLEVDGPQNVFSGRGCGTLCMGEGTDVDSDWCKTIKGQYCRKNDSNMLTDHCYDFCSSHPDICDDYLSGDNGMCSRLGIKSQEDLDKEVPGTIHKYSDWCGCMMPRSFYEEYANKIDAQFNNLGYSILGQIDLSPECMYPKCKQGSIMTFAQDRRKREGMCTDCVQIMLQSLSGDIVDSDIASEQSASCGKVKQQFLLPGVYNAKSIDKYIRVFDDKKYCVYPDEDSMKSDKEKNNLGDAMVIDSIPGENLNSGSCQIVPGYYLVRSNNRLIKVHSDRSYCVYPEGFDINSLGVNYSTIDTIPRMNDRNETEPDCPISEYTKILKSLGLQGLIGFQIGDMDSDESIELLFGLIISCGLIFIIIMFTIIGIYIRKKIS